MKTKQKEAPPAIAEEEDIDMGEPSQTDVHVDAQVKKKGQNLAYYKHLAGQMKPKFTDEEYAAMMKKARSHAGGTAKAQNQAAKASAESLSARISEIDSAFCTQFRSWDGSYSMWTVEIFDAYVIARNSRDGEMYQVDFTEEEDQIVFGEPFKVETQYIPATELADICAHGKASHLFMELNCAEAPDWIPYLPLPGDYKHPRYGEIKITPERNANFVDNFKTGKYQEELPIDAEHETKLSGALGWVKDMRVNDDGSVDAKVDWTDRGVTAFEEDRFKYFSPEWYDNWEDPTDGTVYSDIAIGGALTTRPFFKEKALRPLVASEKGIYAFDGELNDLKEGYTSIYFTALTASSATQGANMAEDKSVKAGDGKTKTLTELQADLDIANKAIEAHRASEEAARTAAELTATENKKLSERVGSLEKDARTKRFNEQAAKWPGEPANHVLLMETLGEGTEPFNAYVKSQDAITAQLKSANIFSEMGSSHSASSDVAQNAEAQLSAKAKEIQAADPKITYEQAYDRALVQNPKLYAEYRRGSN